MYNPSKRYIPSKAEAAFAHNMEDGLEVDKRPYDPKHSLNCLDEMPNTF